MSFVLLFYPKGSFLKVLICSSHWQWFRFCYINPKKLVKCYLKSTLVVLYVYLQAIRKCETKQVCWYAIMTASDPTKATCCYMCQNWSLGAYLGHEYLLQHDIIYCYLPYEVSTYGIMNRKILGPERILHGSWQQNKYDINPY